MHSRILITTIIVVTATLFMATLAMMMVQPAHAICSPKNPSVCANANTSEGSLVNANTPKSGNAQSNPSVVETPNKIATTSHILCGDNPGVVLHGHLTCAG